MNIIGVHLLVLNFKPSFSDEIIEIFSWVCIDRADLQKYSPVIDKSEQLTVSKRYTIAIDAKTVKEINIHFRKHQMQTFRNESGSMADNTMKKF